MDKSQQQNQQIIQSQQQQQVTQQQNQFEDSDENESQEEDYEVAGTRFSMIEEEPEEQYEENEQGSNNQKKSYSGDEEQNNLFDNLVKQKQQRESQGRVSQKQSEEQKRENIKSNRISVSYYDHQLDDKKKRFEKSQKEKHEQEKQEKILTFIDFSHLSYVPSSKLSRQTLTIEQNLNIENFVDNGNQPSQIQDELFNIKEFALEIIDEIADVIIDSVEDAHKGNQQNNNQLITNQSIKNNIKELRKKVFVKEKKYHIKKPSEIVQENFDDIFAQKENEYDFLLPPPPEKDKNSVKMKVYLFGTPKFLEIHISKRDLVGDVKRHVMTLYQKDVELQSENKLKFPSNPDAYDLRLIDDDEDYYTPFMEISPLDKHEEIGEFESLAFVEAQLSKKQKQFMQSQSYEDDSVKDKQLEESLRLQNVNKYLDHQNSIQKRMITVEINTTILTTKFKLILHEDDQLKKVLDEIARKVGEQFLNPKQYVLAPVNKFKTKQCQPLEKSEMKLNIAQQTGFFNYEANELDMNTYIRNLKNSTVELREKIFVDKPLRKQKEIPIENQHALAATFIQGREQALNQGEGRSHSDNRSSFNSNNLNNNNPYGLSPKVLSSFLLPPPQIGFHKTNSQQSFQDNMFQFEEVGNSHRKVEDILLGPVSAVQHEEFQVIKINNRGKEQKRVFAIDGYNIYNYRNKRTDKKSSFIGSFIQKRILNIKKKIRPINKIENIRKHDEKTFEIIMNYKNEKKVILYRCFTADDCSVILAKLNFLRAQQDKVLQAKRISSAVQASFIMPSPQSQSVQKQQFLV